jgi:hypothetical protein
LYTRYLHTPSVINVRAATRPYCPIGRVPSERPHQIWRARGVLTLGIIGSMKWVQARIVDALEMACRATRFVEWRPGWDHLYPRCQIARLSSQLDYRWHTNRWPIHDEDGDDAWDEWWDGLSDERRASGWHNW